MRFLLFLITACVVAAAYSAASDTTSESINGIIDKFVRLSTSFKKSLPEDMTLASVHTNFDLQANGQQQKPKWGSIYADFSGDTCSVFPQQFIAIRLYHCYAASEGSGFAAVSFGTAVHPIYGEVAFYKSHLDRNCRDSPTPNPVARLGCNSNGDGTSTLFSTGSSPIMPKAPGILQSGYENIVACINDVADPYPRKASSYMMSYYHPGTSCARSEGGSFSQSFTCDGNAFERKYYNSTNCSGNPNTVSLLPSVFTCPFGSTSIGNTRTYSRVGCYKPAPPPRPTRRPTRRPNAPPKNAPKTGSGIRRD